MLDSKAFKMSLGLPGSYKTMDMTEQDVLPALIAGEQVYASYWVNWSLPNFHFCSSFDDVRYVRNALIAMDEITDWFDPREWEREDSGMRRWVRCHRKRHLSITANTQDFSFVAKTFGVVVSEWWFYEAEEFEGIGAWLRSLFGRPSLSFTRELLTLPQLKQKMSGFTPFFSDSDFSSEQEGEGSQDVDEPILEYGGYTLKEITHPELDDYKIEIVHRYCPLCKARQGDQILKADTEKICDWDHKRKIYFLRNEEFCPRHTHQPLEVRFSAMYDTDYEPPIAEKPLRWVPMAPCPAGWREIPYKGVLSDQQVALKRALEEGRGETDRQ